MYQPHIDTEFYRQVFRHPLSTIDGAVLPARTAERDHHIREPTPYELRSVRIDKAVRTLKESEYPAVVIPLLTQHYVMLQRNLLYTAITRGKKLVVIVGTKKALRIAVANDKTKKRYTRLAERLRGEK